MCLEFLSDNNAILFSNVYKPCDNNDNHDDFLHQLGKINSIIGNHRSSLSCISGDLNANMIDGCKSLFGNVLILENVVIADGPLLENTTFTFYSQAHNTVFWLDHVVVSGS